MSFVSHEVFYDPAARMIRARGFGNWGKEEATAYDAAVAAELTKAAPRGPFTVLIDISGLGVLPQSVVGIVMGTAAKINASPASRIALVTDRALSRLQSQRISANPSNLLICVTLAEGQEWLAGSEAQEA